MNIDESFLMSKNNIIMVNCDIGLPNTNYLWIRIYEFSLYAAINTSIGAVYHLRNKPMTNISCFGDSQIQFSHNFTTTSTLSHYGPGELNFRIGIHIDFDSSVETLSSTELGDSNWLGPINYLDDIDDTSNKMPFVDEGVLIIVPIFILSSGILFLLIYCSQKKQNNEKKGKYRI